MVSLFNLTSAGQVAAVNIMGNAGISLSGGLIEMAVSTFVINLRYALMAISLSQKTDETMTTPARLVTGFAITDEIFGVASSQEKVTRNYMLGLSVLPIVGWTLGTLLGGVCGNILPSIVTNSLAIGIYGMFVAIVLPVSRKNKAIAFVSIVAVILSIICYYVPFLNAHISSGFAIIICSIIASLLGVFFMTPDENKEVKNG